MKPFWLKKWKSWQFSLADWSEITFFPGSCHLTLWTYLTKCRSMFVKCCIINFKDSHETLKYWVGVQRGHSYLMGRRCLFRLGWPPFYWWCHDKNALWGRCFTSTSFAPNLFLLGWLKLNLALLLDQSRLAWQDKRWW